MRKGIYIHIPVCRRKCLYCDFYSVGERQFTDRDEFVHSVIREAESRKSEFGDCTEVTIYIGGGTPSLIPVDTLQKLLEGVRGVLLEVSPDAEIIETTIEVNPDDVTEERAVGWREAGINRVSMGVQSLVDAELKFIGRRHDSESAIKAYSILRKFFSNISLDLMFGLPGQTLESLKYTLDRFVELRPEHISAYSLMYEERTALTRMRDAGQIAEADEDVSVRMFEIVSERLRSVGYDRYEISNYSLTGYESRHNSSYWEGIPYIGLGPSAHSFDGYRCRRWNVADVKRYINGIKRGEIVYEKESLSDDELREEMIMTGLRTARGIDLERYKDRWGEKEFTDLLKRAEKHMEKGEIAVCGGFMSLTDCGVMVSDEIMVNLF